MRLLVIFNYSLSTEKEKICMKLSKELIERKHEPEMIKVAYPMLTMKSVGNVVLDPVEADKLVELDLATRNWPAKG